MTKTRPIARTRSLIQGDPSSPSDFRVALDPLLCNFDRMCQQRSWGILLDSGRRVGIITFADNYWIIAHDESTGVQMHMAWLNLLQEAGWKVELASMQWMSTRLDDQGPHALDFGLGRVERRPKRVGMNILGAIVTTDNCCELEVRHRIERAWGAFLGPS